jgi:anti-sigma factor RsiW
MNCQEMGPIITDLARNTAIEVDARDRALAHVTECRQCSNRLAEEKRLTEGLLAWAAASMEDQAPPSVEEKLGAAFRRQPAPVWRGRGWLTIAAVGSIAAAILLFKLPAPHVVAPPAPPQKAVVVAQAPPPVNEIKKSRQANRLSHRRPVEREIATEFLPVAVDDGWTPLDGGRLVRVKLPRSALGVFGLPVSEERGPERVQADVMLSNDGVLRAIRFVR